MLLLKNRRGLEMNLMLGLLLLLVLLLILMAYYSGMNTESILWGGRMEENLTEISSRSLLE